MDHESRPMMVAIFSSSKSLWLMPRRSLVAWLGLQATSAGPPMRASRAISDDEGLCPIIRDYRDDAIELSHTYRCNYCSGTNCWAKPSDTAGTARRIAECLSLLSADDSRPSRPRPRRYTKDPHRVAGEQRGRRRCVGRPDSARRCAENRRTEPAPPPSPPRAP